MSTNGQSDADVFASLGQAYVIKIVRLVPESLCYGLLLILTSAWVTLFVRHRERMKGSLFLISITTIMFIISTMFLAMDFADLIIRLRTTLNADTTHTLADKATMADVAVKRLVWIGEMIFIFGLNLGDSVVLWRTWWLYRRDSFLITLLPILTWLGAFASALFELGCDVNTHWAINNTISAGSVGAKRCARSDLSSFTLSFATNVICTILIGFKAWRHRKFMAQYLVSAPRRTKTEKILTLLVESGCIYLVFYVLQSIPIYSGSSPGSPIAWEIVNALIQQAMGIYPIALCVLIHQETSIWDAPEVSQYIFTSVYVEDSSYGHGQVGEVNLTIGVMDVDSSRSDAEMEMSHHDKSTLRERDVEDAGERIKTRHRNSQTSHEIRITPGSESRFGPGVTAAEMQSTMNVSQRSRIPSKTIQEPSEPGEPDGGSIDLEKVV